jgi:hypothetical protein
MKKLLVASLLLIGGSSLFGMHNWRQKSDDSGQYANSANQAPCYGSHFPSQPGPQCPTCFPAVPAKADVPRSQSPQSPAVKVK